MKKFIFLVAMVALFATVFQTKGTAQNSTPRTYTIMDRTVKLNGGARAFISSSFGAASRMALPITLPRNTAEWYYSYSTTSGGQNNSGVKLGVQLASLLADAYAPGSGMLFRGLTGSAFSNVEVSQGTMPINAYLLDGNNGTLFLNKQQFNYYDGTQMERTTEGKQQIIGMNYGTYYLGLQNISSTSPVFVHVEVVAIIRGQ